VLLPSPTSLPDASGLQEQVERSGINYEAHVKHVLLNESLAPEEHTKLTNDLKGQLLELEQHLGRLDSNDAARTDLLRQVQRSIQNIELQQLSNLFAHAEHQPILLQLTHPMFAAAYTAQLYVRNNASQQQAQHQGRQDYTLVFLLDFTELGALRVDASVRDSQVQATINVEQQAAADFVAAHLPDLTARLHALGFQAHVDCCTHEKVSREVDATLTRLPIPEASRLVDIRA
jgi:flagellar hook-length control protein FliK